MLFYALLVARVRRRFFALFDKTVDELDGLIAEATVETKAVWLEAVTTIRNYKRDGREITDQFARIYGNLTESPMINHLPKEKTKRTKRRKR